MASTRTYLVTLPITSILRPRPLFSLKIHNSSLALISPFNLSATEAPNRTIHFQNPIPGTYKKRTKIWELTATSTTDVLPSDADAVVSTTGDDGVSTIISALLFVAFIGLSILTIGVIYIAVTDFLQKREKEKFEKDEAAKKKKKSGKKGQVRARAGPRGFGQKALN